MYNPAKHDRARSTASHDRGAELRKLEVGLLVGVSVDVRSSSLQHIADVGLAVWPLSFFGTKLGDIEWLVGPPFT